jgi:ATP-dependent Clp protease ATP-binding subunit ClpB
MNLNKYTEKAQEAVVGSQQLAEQSGHPLIEPEHLLVTLAEQPEGIVPEVLRKMSVDPGELARATRELLKKSPQAYGGAQPGLSPRLKVVTDSAEARPHDSRTNTSAPSICWWASSQRRAVRPRVGC